MKRKMNLISQMPGIKKNFEHSHGNAKSKDFHLKIPPSGDSCPIPAPPPPEAAPPTGLKAVNLDPPRIADDELIDGELEVVLDPKTPPDGDEEASTKDVDELLGEDRRGCEKAPTPPLKGCSKREEDDEEELEEEDEEELEMFADDGVGL